MDGPINWSRARGRAVTLDDYERLAARTPGGHRIARVTAIANMHPDFPCFKAHLGIVTVIVLCRISPEGSPAPTPIGLLRAGRRLLESAPSYWHACRSYRPNLSGSGGSGNCAIGDRD